MANTIDKQTPVTPSLSDQIAIFYNNWRTARTSLTLLLELFQNNLVFPDAGRPEPDTQYSAPAATGFNITIDAGTDGNNDVHLILTPAAAYATGAITLPAVGTLRDKQEVIVNCTKQVTAFTVNANGATAVYGAPTAMAADDFFTLKYDLTVSSWYRIG
jgi:hypothetical protein